MPSRWLRAGHITNTIGMTEEFTTGESLQVVMHSRKLLRIATGGGRGVRISVIGCGYLGAVHAASLTELGHDVVGIDVDERKVAHLSRAHRRSTSRVSRTSWSTVWRRDG